MGRCFGDADDQEWDDVQTNAVCTDCGTDFSRADGDVGTWCDTCSDRRDAWTSALELTMATAALRSDVPFVVDVLIVPADPQAPRGPVVEVALEPRANVWSRLPTLSAVAASRAGKPIPKQKPSRRKIA